MQKFSQLRPIARGYVAVVVGVGLAAVVHSVTVLFLGTPFRRNGSLSLL